eukprot:TRINITY_DN1868_c0_g1_i3.p1 TRINITY_DN1868_c0_g1~~TRINITY_DN1868_c0_g1_i3.p1  ORF type:complete len:318 (+),score=62.56 TRINITY_DN1868_c0_g1_i3:774-1727(+)
MSALHVSMSNKPKMARVDNSYDSFKLPSISVGTDFSDVFPLSSQAQMKNFYNEAARKDNKRLAVFLEEETNSDIVNNQSKLTDSCLHLPQSHEAFLRKSKDKIAALSKLSCELLEQCEREESVPVKPAKRLFSSVDREEGGLPFLQLPPLTPTISSTPNTPPLSPFQTTLTSPSHKRPHLSSSIDYENYNSSPRMSEESSSPFMFSPINPPSSSPLSSTLEYPTFTPTASRPSTSPNTCWWKTNSNQTVTDQGGHYFCVCNPTEKLSKTYNKGKCSKCHHHLKWWCDVCQKAMWWNGRTAHRTSNAHQAGCKALSKK